MAEVIFAESFISEMAQVETKKLRDTIFDTLTLLEEIPEMGSANLPASIIAKYGSDVRKLVVKPFLILYKILPQGDILVLGVMHNRAAY